MRKRESVSARGREKATRARESIDNSTTVV